jgi:hypothetical protein
MKSKAPNIRKFIEFQRSFYFSKDNYEDLTIIFEKFILLDEGGKSIIHLHTGMVHAWFVWVVQQRCSLRRC